MRYCRVSFSIKPDIEFDYKLRKGIKYQIGDIVVAPLRGRTEIGVVVDLMNSSDVDDEKIKSIYGKLDISIPEILIKTAKLASDYFVYSLGQFLRLSFPLTSLSSKNKYVVISEEYEDIFIDKMGDYYNSIFPASVFIRMFGRNVMNEWINKKYIKTISVNIPVPSYKWQELVNSDMKRVPVYTYNDNCFSINTDKKFILTKNQKDVYDTVVQDIKKDKGSNYLLFGVTGSGKTEVYLHLTEFVIKNGKTAIVMVPEIVLAEQIVNAFRERFGNIVGVIHSKMKNKERYNIYRDIVCGRIKIVIGVRSAVWAPLKNLGIIIIDEEHSQNYHQYDMSPRYDAITVARMRMKYENCVILQGSATPSSYSWYRYKKGKIKLLELKERIGKAGHPKVNIVNTSYSISDAMKKEIEKRLENKQQVIVFYNRRGFSRVNVCPSCGYVQMCKNCSISLVYHKKPSLMRCHYCNYTQKVYEVCPNCGEKMEMKGYGTQKIEERLKDMFPNSIIERLDYDRVSKREEMVKILEDFKNGKIDILIGTQMVSKGFDIPNVNLVCIVDADSMFNMPDFSSEERFLQMIYQTAGRSGRGNEKGEVIIETTSPQYVYEILKDYDYKREIERILEKRKEWGYPPYVYMHRILWNFTTEEKRNKFIRKISPYLKKIEEKTGMILLGPIPPLIDRIERKYRLHLIVRGNNLKESINTVNFIVEKFGGYPDIDTKDTV